jgi:hypothetical protein
MLGVHNSLGAGGRNVIGAEFEVLAAAVLSR